MLGLFKILKKQKTEREQVLEECGCVCYCPECSNILNSNSYVSETEDGIVTYKCSKCSEDVKFHFGVAPIPILWEAA